MLSVSLIPGTWWARSAHLGNVCPSLPRTQVTRGVGCTLPGIWRLPLSWSSAQPGPSVHPGTLLDASLAVSICGARDVSFTENGPGTDLAARKCLSKEGEREEAGRKGANRHRNPGGLSGAWPPQAPAALPLLWVPGDCVLSS